MKDKCCVFVTKGEEGTMRAGRLLAEVTGGIIAVEGGLGAGKTVFARGIAAGLGISECITSPTFNIINVYEKGGTVFNHMDAYRITDPEMLYDIGFEEIIGDGDVTVIEWADTIMERIPRPCIWIRIRRTGETGTRMVFMEGPGTTVEEFAGRWK